MRYILGHTLEHWRNVKKKEESVYIWVSLLLYIFFLERSKDLRKLR
jgi:hypothetical protein